MMRSKYLNKYNSGSILVYGQQQKSLKIPKLLFIKRSDFYLGNVMFFFFFLFFPGQSSKNKNGRVLLAVHACYCNIHGTRLKKEEVK